MSRDVAAKRLQNFIREHTSGGCRILSEGDGCLCPLCDLARLMEKPEPLEYVNVPEPYCHNAAERQAYAAGHHARHMMG